MSLCVFPLGIPVEDVASVVLVQFSLVVFSLGIPVEDVADVCNGRGLGALVRIRLPSIGRCHTQSSSLLPLSPVSVASILGRFCLYHRSLLRLY